MHFSLVRKQKLNAFAEKSLLKRRSGPQKCCVFPELTEKKFFLRVIRANFFASVFKREKVKSIKMLDLICNLFLPLMKARCAIALIRQRRISNEESNHERI